MKNFVSSFVIGIAVIITACILGSAYKYRYRSDEVISVTGLGSRDFDSDLVVWNGSFSRMSKDMKTGYAELERDRRSILDYLKSKGVNEKEIVFSSINFYEEYSYSYDQNGYEKSRIFDGYKLSQNITIESKEVDKIENISRQVTELINQGVQFYSESPQYYYTKLAELKIEMVAEATEDGRIRAEQIAKNANGKLGGLKNATMGIFQITGQNSNEDYSWGGAFNTMSRKKTATITMKLQFKVR